DLRPLLQRAEIYVQPSRREAFGLAALEAMQAGLPVIASAVGGLPELVVDGATGRLVPPGDVDALATAMAVLINDPELRRTWGTAARQRAEQHYGVEQFCTAIRDLYASAGGRK
ncbi:MAG TPA: glycosyltransferase family 4 protein, partial [Mycobacteriales bacterium]|nr:glycosyltransferase family 4 protein [Mycobacteriales bacterium]